MMQSGQSDKKHKGYLSHKNAPSFVGGLPTLLIQQRNSCVQFVPRLTLSGHRDEFNKMKRAEYVVNQGQLY